MKPSDPVPQNTSRSARIEPWRRLSSRIFIEEERFDFGNARIVTVGYPRRKAQEAVVMLPCGEDEIGGE